MAGNFTASNLYPILESINKMWSNSRQAQDSMADIESVRSISENQKVDLDPILVNGECRGYEVAWLKRCDAAATLISTAAADCAITGAEMDSQKQLYNTFTTYGDSFTVWDDQCKDKFTAEDKIAEGLMASFKVLKEKLNTNSAIFLNANLQANAYITGLGTVAGTVTTIPAVNWTADLIAEFALIVNINKIDANAVTLTGTNLWSVLFNADYNNLNVTQRDQLAKMRHFKKWYADPVVVDTVAGAKATFLFDPGGVAMWTRNLYQNEAPKNNNDPLNTMTYNMPDKELVYMDNGRSVPVRYDIATQVECKPMADGTMRFGRKFKVLLHYALELSPANCAGTTGIIKIVKGA